AADFARFVAALLADPRGMLVRQTAAPQTCSNCINRPDPGGDSPIISWGLGVALVQHEGRDYLWHWGDNGPFKTYLFADAQSRRGVVVLMNGAGGLSIAGDIAGHAVPELAEAAQVPLAWLRYDRWDSPRFVLFRRILAEGVSAVPAIDLPEPATNSLGYSLLRAGRKEEAIAVFRRNTDRFPSSWNAWDSLGEGLAAADRREEAIAAYRKSLELNPENSSATTMLDKLQR
ncbi:MAG TPA: tetratricopeptide repeat protein, partial [Thermoanaerobaculia bacterium]|nr:tetratricopeptide repeat protein [Thermoanaerobaculia bacterium]